MQLNSVSNPLSIGAPVLFWEYSSNNLVVNDPETNERLATMGYFEGWWHVFLNKQEQRKYFNKREHAEDWVRQELKQGIIRRINEQH